MSAKTLEDDKDHLRISNLVFSFGNKNDNINYNVKCGNVVILVGPNNSGKSSTLKEIEDYCLGGNKKLKVLSDIQFNTPLTENGMKELIDMFRLTIIPKDFTVQAGEYLLSIPHVKGEEEAPQYQRIDPVYLENSLRQATITKDMMNNHIIKFFTILLDGERRFDLIKNKPRGSLQNPPANSFSSVFRDESIYEKIDSIIYKEFGWHFYLDHTGPKGLLSISFSHEKFPNWKSQDESSINFFSKSTPITDIGDGIKIFTGLLIAAMSLPQKIFLVDEPEAFLHPPKARSLGTYLTNLIEERKASFIVSTHSPDFVLGCLDESTNITIIRLGFDGEKGTTRHLDSNQVLQLTTDPILRTTETINALFHDSAVVAEDHSDRVFYKEIFDKYQIKSKDEKNRTKINDAVFLNTNGKHRIHRIFGPLRKMGIPSAAIYDLDIVRHESNHSPEGTIWKTILSHANVPKFEFERLESERAELEKNLNAISESEMIPFKRKGLEKLEKERKEKGEKLLSELQKYGIFIVPTGELESWSSDITEEEYSKPYWLEKILQKLDDDKSIILSEKKIWAFMKDINTWQTNPNRLGMDLQTSTNN